MSLLREAAEYGRLPRAPSADVPWVALPERPCVRHTPAERRTAIARLLSWATDGGARWHGIAFEVDARGDASVRTTRAIAVGDEVLRLPRRLMLEVPPGERDPRDVLAAWLAREVRDPRSRWAPFLDALPRQLPELPMFHAPPEGTFAYALAAEDNRAVRAAHGDVELADFAWGCAIVTSRGYHAPGTFEHRIALLPLVELFDHGLGDTTWTYDPATGELAITAERAFAAGEPIHFPYGERGNTWLYVHHGFVLPDNPHDDASLLFEPFTDPLARLWASSARVPIACVLDDRVLAALSIARLLAASPDDRARAVELGLAPDGYLPFLGFAHERAALAILHAAARRSLAALDAAPLGADRTTAIVRASERAVLVRFLAWPLDSSQL